MFWMIFVDKRDSFSTKKWDSLSLAQEEAARLARLNPGIKVYILKDRPT